MKKIIITEEQVNVISDYMLTETLDELGGKYMGIAARYQMNQRNDDRTTKDMYRNVEQIYDKAKKSFLSNFRGKEIKLEFNNGYPNGSIRRFIIRDISFLNPRNQYFKFIGKLHYEDGRVDGPVDVPIYLIFNQHTKQIYIQDIRNDREIIDDFSIVNRHELSKMIKELQKVNVEAFPHMEEET